MPAGHALQLVEFSVEPKRPTGHTGQKVELLVDVKVPMSHPVHDVVLDPVVF